MSGMDTAYVREKPPANWPYKVEYLHFRFLIFLVTAGFLATRFESTILLRVFVDALGLKSGVVLGFSEQNWVSDRFYRISRKNSLKGWHFAGERVMIKTPR